MGRHSMDYEMDYQPVVEDHPGATDRGAFDPGTSTPVASIAPPGGPVDPGVPGSPDVPSAPPTPEPGPDSAPGAPPETPSFPEPGPPASPEITPSEPPPFAPDEADDGATPPTSWHSAGEQVL